MLIDENDLDAFRRERLSPAALLALIEQSVAAAIQLGIGVGKSVAVDVLLACADLYKRFDLVIYVAPTWKVISERAVYQDREGIHAPVLVIKPRPKEKCGPFAREWDRLERQGCSALGKATLCKQCGKCDWPTQLRDIKGTRVVLGTERQFLLNRHLVPMLRMRTGAKRVLLLLDEARLLDADFGVRLSRPALEAFHECLELVAASVPDLARKARTWSEWVHDLLFASVGRCLPMKRHVPGSLLKRAADIQQIGVNRFGEGFHFLGYDLSSLRSSRREERWIDVEGTIHFTARPYLSTHLLAFSACLDGDYVAHRLGEERVASPFSDVVVRHSKTRIINLQSRLGARRYFGKNSKQILDTFAVVLRRNILAGRTSLLVARKHTVERCAGFLAERLKRWGLDVTFLLDGAKPGTPPDPRVVPVIHYGVLGVNEYTEYESAYCLNSYYLPSGELSRRVQEFEHPRDRVELAVRNGPAARRRVLPANPDDQDLGRAYLGSLYLKRLEVDPAIQAVGRVRFLTMPREVVFFQMADLGEQLGPVTVVRSLEQLRHELDIPKAKDVDRELQAGRIRELVQAGTTVADACQKLGLSRATGFRRLGGSLKSPAKYLRRDSETPGGAA